MNEGVIENNTAGLLNLGCNFMENMVKYDYGGDSLTLK